MNEFFMTSTFFALVITLLGYQLGVFLKNKTGIALFNPLLISIIVVIGILLLTHVDYESYESGTQILSYFLTPSTVALAVPLYRQMAVLKKNWAAVLLGILSGVVTSLLCTLVLAWCFHLSHEEYVTLLPKSITTAVGMAMSEELGGMVMITVAAIVLTGIVGGVLGEFVCRIFHIEEKVAIGLAMGTSAHVIGTTKAMEMGEIQGAMSSLSIVVAGLLTVIAANLFAVLY
jgi:predicted murein hydrolase (TIGR00659 family)